MNTVILQDRGLIDYMECWALQEGFFDSLVAAKRLRDQKGGAQIEGVRRAQEDGEQKEGARSVRVDGARIDGEWREGVQADGVQKDGARRDGGQAEGEQGVQAEGGNVSDEGRMAGNSQCQIGARDDARQVLILCEHPHVYTLGKSGKQNNLLVDEAFLGRIGATYYRVDRGGDITYHGPGQLVGYPILDLDKIGIGLKDYVRGLEHTIIETVAQFGIGAGQSEGATGVWLPADENGPLRKIAAIGVRSSHFVTMHGFALNVDASLEYFTHINPCGFTDRGVTSMARELGDRVPMEEVKRVYAEAFEKVFAVKLGRG